MREQLSLESKLDAYEATSGEERRAVKGRRRNWRLYAAAAGSGLALTTSAEAGIIYSGALDVTAAPGPNAAKQWTANIDGVNFVGRVSRQTFQTNFHGQGHVANAGLVAGGSWLKNTSSQVQRLASGAKISGGAGSFGNKASQGIIYGHNDHSGEANFSGSFSKGKPAFAGIKIGSHYGWMELEWNGDAKGHPTSLTLLGWAYDTVPNEAIEAGEMGSAVPEPSTGLMMLLATGSGGVLAWRKRRQRPAATA